MRTFVFIPPLARVSGGLAVLLTLADQLHDAGFPVRLVPREGTDAAPANAETSLANLAHRLPLTPWKALPEELTPEDIWLVPEGWVNALAPGLAAKARCVVYCQNQAFLFSALPENVTWHQLPVSFLAVSRPVATFIKTTLGKDVPVLPPGLDRSLFHPPAADERTTRRPLTIGWMPRKNKGFAKDCRAAFEHLELAAGRTPARLAWTALVGLSRTEVAERLRACHVFLATGYPEGFGLPPLEAMACGALPVGCAGYGGFEFMRQNELTPLTAGGVTDAREQTYLRLDEGFGGNGIWTRDGDPLSAALALSRAVELWESGSEPLGALRRAGQQTADAYNLSHQAERARAIWTRAASGTLFPTHDSQDHG